VAQDGIERHRRPPPLSPWRAYTAPRAAEKGGKRARTRNDEMPRMPLAAGDGAAFFELEDAPSLAFLGLPAPAFFSREPGVVELEEAFAGGLPAPANADSAQPAATLSMPPAISGTPASATMCPAASASVKDAIAASRRAPVPPIRVIEKF
jgi:hypothetical protein